MVLCACGDVCTPRPFTGVCRVWDTTVVDVLVFLVGVKSLGRDGGSLDGQVGLPPSFRS